MIAIQVCRKFPLFHGNVKVSMFSATLENGVTPRNFFSKLKITRRCLCDPPECSCEPRFLSKVPGVVTLFPINSEHDRETVVHRIYCCMLRAFSCPCKRYKSPVSCRIKEVFLRYLSWTLLPDRTSTFFRISAEI